jgi:ABC-type nitrate/sulfonate/bicarbonate transport system substrate-binding protein
MRKVKASMMNAIHDLPLLVARDEGYFRDEGLEVEILKTPGSGQRTRAPATSSACASGA